MKKITNLLVGFGLLTGAILFASIIVGNAIFGVTNVADAAICPPITAHPTEIFFNPEPVNVNQTVNIKTDTVYECGSASCVWYWTGSVNKTTSNTNGSFNISFSSAGTKSVCVEVRADWGDGCGSVRVAYGCDTLVVKNTVTPTPTPPIPTPTPTPPIPTPTPTPTPTPGYPSVDIKANGYDGPIIITSGSSATLSWVSNNANSCSASGSWSGSKSTSGSQSTGILTSAKNYTITCINSYGSATDNVIIYTSTDPTPTPTPTIFPTPTPTPWPTYPPTCIPPGINTVNIYREPNPVCAGQSGLYKTQDIFECYGYYCEWRWSGDVGNVTNMNTPNGNFYHTFTNGGTKNLYVGVWKRMSLPNCAPDQYYQIATGYLNFNVGDFCTYSPTPTPTYSPTPTPTPPICQHNLLALPLAQTSCVATPGDGGTCNVTSSDGFNVRYNLPAGAVSENTNINVFIYRASDLSAINVRVGNLSIIGNKIVQVIAEYGNCNQAVFSKDAVINFTYPSSYAYGYVESSFTDYNTPVYANNWFMLPTARNTSSNYLTSLTRNLGYFAIYGQRIPYVPTPTPTITPSPTPEILGTICACPPTDPTDNDFLDSLFLASLIDAFKNIHISWCQFLGFLNLLLLLLLLWFAFYKKEKQEQVEQKTLVFNNSANATAKKSTFWQWLAIPFIALFAWIGKLWKDRKEKNKFWKEFKNNNTSLSSLINDAKEKEDDVLSGTYSSQKNDEDGNKDSQFVIIK